MIPVAIWAGLELAAAAVTAYEIYDLVKTLYDGLTEFTGKKEEAKKYVEKMMKSLQNEMNADIDEKFERQLLASLTMADVKLQSEQTRNMEGRIGEGGELIKTAIKMPMPFRQQLTMVCDLANKTPVFSLKRKQGVQVKDLKQVKKKILAELARVAIEEIANVDLEGLLLVRLRQLMVSHLIEFMDELLGWQSPMKAEACFGPSQSFTDPPLKGGTRLRRDGTEINPFYPMPHRHRGSMAIDVAITDYRKEPLTKANLFGIVEIKFAGDAIRNRQFEKYERLSKECAKSKTAKVGKAKTLESKGVTKGARVSLFRYPEDRAVDHKEKTSSSTGRKKGGGKK